MQPKQMTSQQLHNQFIHEVNPDISIQYCNRCKKRNYHKRSIIMGNQIKWKCLGCTNGNHFTFWETFSGVSK